MRARLVLGAIVAIACGPSSLPPLPEVLLVVDTDLPTPLVASRVRIDLYTEDGTWFDSVEVSRPDARDWPMSFGVYSNDETRASSAWVRVRVYPDGLTRDYRGERPHTWDGPLVGGDATAGPRLVRDGRDVTPLSEPDPLTAVDRLAHVTLAVGQERRVGLTLHGACVGTSALLGSDPTRGPARGEAQTCVDTEKTLVTVDDSVVERPPESSHAGTWLADACPTASAEGSSVCVPGGATMIGTIDASANVTLSSLPRRVFGVHTFWMDRTEVTVGRFRAAVAAGFHPTTMPAPWDHPLEDNANHWCAYTTLPMDREDYAVTCIEWRSARQFCQYEGGDLPTEAQWEHAALVAGRPHRSTFTWGDDVPDCGRAVFGRSVVGGRTCPSQPEGVAPTTDPATDRNALGILALAGGVQEWTLDRGSTYSDACWSTSAIVDPLCGDPNDLGPKSTRIIRGEAFLAPAITDLGARFTLGTGLVAGIAGFRCVYPKGP